MNFSIKNSTYLALCVLLFACNTKDQVKPVIKDIKELVFASGELQWDNPYNLTAQTDGVLIDANFEVGNLVNKGTTIAKIDNKTNQINVQTSQEQLVIANQNITPNAPALQQLQQNIIFADTKYKQDKIQAERYQRLYESQSVSRLEYENMLLNAKNSLANYNALQKQYVQIKQQAQQQQISTQAQLKNNRVLAYFNQIIVPETGTVIKKLKNNGDYIKKGEIIATIANQKKVEAVLNIDENSIAKIKVGQPVFIQLNTNKNKIYAARITQILSAFDTQSQSFICKAAFDTIVKATLFGTQLEANILVGDKKNALLIPRNYMGFGNKVNVKGKDAQVIIKPGIISTDYVEVLSGINQQTILLPLKH